MAGACGVREGIEIGGGGGVGVGVGFSLRRGVQCPEQHNDPSFYIYEPGDMANVDF